MFERALLAPIMHSSAYQKLENAIKTNKSPCSILDITVSEKLLWIRSLVKHKKPIIIVVPDGLVASTLLDGLKDISNIKADILPPRPVSLHRIQASSHEIEGRRISIMGRALDNKIDIIIAPIDSLMQKMAPPNIFAETSFKISVGQRIDPVKVVEKLAWSGYVRKDTVTSPGQFSLRGDLLDVFTLTGSQPVRINFFDIEVDTIKVFDADTQRSVKSVKSVNIYPATEVPLNDSYLKRGYDIIKLQARETIAMLNKGDIHTLPDKWSAVSDGTPTSRLESYVAEIGDSLATGGTFAGINRFLSCFYPYTATIFDYVKDSILVMDEPVRCKEHAEDILSEYISIFNEAIGAGDALKFQVNNQLGFEDVVKAGKASFNITMQGLNKDASIVPKAVINVDGVDMHIYRGQFNMLKSDIRKWKQLGLRIIIMSGNKSRADRLIETLTDYEIFGSVINDDKVLSPGELGVVPMPLLKGFVNSNAGIAVIGEKELFGSSRHKLRSRASKRKSADLLSDLSAGDFVVHEAHGIGQFCGIEKLTSNKLTRDYLKIQYKSNDVLYVPTEQMDRVQKYVGSDSKNPKVSSLGGRAWKNAKNKAQKAIEDMAEDLLVLYAEREIAKGHVYSEDSEWQRQFEENFPFDETEDQLKAIEEIKDDMHSGRIMDRLLCGDVGYGKTEVALRAVFKAVMDKKQVAILAPTTILAHQHYMTAFKRFKDFGITIAELSRFKTAGQQRDIIARLKTGKIDVVIGTHRLLSEDVKFLDLGLLVVDEEQRFGVTHKERIKKMRKNTDVLTLTATPIPRTLHMSMVGIRDISVIDTPPQERHPVQTFVTEYDERLIKHSIQRELGRGGQIYFLYNRVESIDIMANRLHYLVPDARIGIGHGQMPEKKLEQVMMDFYEGNYDILLCTTIIESGLDVPKANTLIVHDADRFGLSQLYQLRGRVGRSNRLAYAYLTWRENKILSEVAEKRLGAIKEFTDFGSGYRIALRDLEIRGAGNLLGSQQHGHMSSIGYGLYCKMIEDTVSKLRGENLVEEVETVLDVKMDAHIPNSYIKEEGDRLVTYRNIAGIRSFEDKDDMIEELNDRFGKVPTQVERLMDIAMLHHKAGMAGIKRLRQQSDVWQMHYDANVHPDPMKIIGLMKDWEGEAVLSGTTPPTVKLKVFPGRNTIEQALILIDGLVNCR